MAFLKLIRKFCIRFFIYSLFSSIFKVIWKKNEVSFISYNVVIITKMCWLKREVLPVHGNLFSWRQDACQILSRFVQ